MTRLRTIGGMAIGAALLAGCASSASQAAGSPRPRSGPASATIGTRYPYDLYTHCGIQNAFFENHWWEADSPTQDDPGKGSSPYTGSVPGTMTLTSATTARFDGPHQLTATFHPLDGTPGACS